MVPPEAAMPIIDSRTWMEHLPEARCWQLLDAATIGRIGVLVDGAPEIFPVNFIVFQHSIVFRADEGTKLRALDRSNAVCFEVDGFDVARQSGWSVLLKGRASELVTADELRPVADASLRYWAAGPKSHWVQITPHEVTGRRIVERGV